MPASLLEAVDAAAVGRRVTRSQLIRGVLEDAIDAGDLPSVAPLTAMELRADADAELERLRELTR